MSRYRHAERTESYLSEGTEVFSDFLLRSVWRETADEDLLHGLLALHGLGFFGVDDLSIELVFLLRGNLHQIIISQQKGLERKNNPDRNLAKVCQWLLSRI